MDSNWVQNDLLIQQSPFHITRTGNGSQPALLLAHGFSDNGMCWQDLALELETRYDVVMPDLRGHGLSARVSRGETIDLAADLAGLIKELGLRNPIVGGHSMGGMESSRLGAHYPGLASALILEDPAWMDIDPAHPRPDFLGENGPAATWIKKLKSQPAEEVMADCRAEHPAWSENVVRRWCEAKQQLDLLFFTAIETSWSEDWRALVRLIRCPTLLVTADVELGGIVTPAMAAEATAVNPLIRVAHIAGAGHHVRFAKPSDYTQVVKQFLLSL